MELGLGALPDFKCLMGAVKSLCEKVSEIFTGSGVVPSKVQTLFD